MLQAIDITKKYRKGQLSATVLSNINLDVNEGEYLSILGPSGSGKTSLLNIVGMLDIPTNGEIIINQHKVSNYTEKERLNFRRKEIGYIFNEANLIEELTVAENVELPLLYQKVKKKERIERVSSLLGEMNILHRKKFHPTDLNELEQQKVAIARAMVIEPSLLLVDEPTGKLNSSDGNELLDILGKINDQGITIILFTHARRIAERTRKVVQLFDGHILLDNVIK